ncbi:MAG: putative endonuclease [Motiliproteus sp.]|jgi:putative endonuclease
MSRTKGDQIERQIEHYLQQQGLQFLQRNFSAACGEIDLIMQQQHTLVFIEVRYRRTALYGSAAESVDLRKQQRICKTAARFLQQQSHYKNYPCRFDVIACHPDNSSGALQIEWLTNAFDAY